MGDFVEAIRVTVMGMGLVFAALSGLMLIIGVLGRVLPDNGAVAPRQPLPQRELPPLAEPLASEPSAEVVAAIAVALASMEQRRQLPRPPVTTVVTFEPGVGAWRALGRLS